MIVLKVYNYSLDPTRALRALAFKRLPSLSENLKHPPHKLKWKLIEGPTYRIVVSYRPLLHFHIMLEECRLCQEPP